MSTALIIFIKNPNIGQVKTRLAKEIGDEQALEIYLELCRLTRVVIHDFPGTKYLFYSDEIISDDDWDPVLFIKQLQSGRDLGERMKNAFSSVFHKNEKIILIGSDCPYLKLTHLNEASQELNKVDCVIGPAKDGGYYLLGLSSMIDELFMDKKWSSNLVLLQTLKTLNEKNHSVSQLETMEDIDTITDWERYLDSTFGS